MNTFLQTDRLYLREMTMGDFDEIALMLKNPEVMYAWEYDFQDCDVEDWVLKCVTLYAEHGLGYFLVLDKLSNSVVGQAALMPDEIEGEKYYEIGYIFKKEHWGKGYATECARALSNYANIHYPNFDKILEIRPENERSKKVAERLGAKVIGSFTKKVHEKTMKHLIYKIT